MSAAPNERSAVVDRAGPVAVTDPWPRNAAAMPASQGRRRRVADAAAGASRDRLGGPRDRAPRRGADDRRAAPREPRASRRQQPPALADDLADGPGADGRQLAADVLGEGE